jgi:hypothetical protein
MRLPLSVSSFAVKGNQEAAPFTVINRATVLVTREDGPASAQRDVSTPPIQYPSELLNELLELISFYLLPK